MEYKCRKSRGVVYEMLESRRLLAFNPTAVEQELLQLTNRFRTDPVGEFSRLIAATAPIQARDPKVTEQLQLAGVRGVDGTLLQRELQALTPAQPLGWNEVMHQMANTHVTTMIAAGPPQRHMDNLSKALQDRGVPIEGVQTPLGLKGAAQNVFGYGASPSFIHAAYIIDWTTDKTDADGMQSPRGHRDSLIQPEYNQIGSPIVAGSNGFGPLVNTQFLAKISSAQKMAVGAVFEDKNKSGWYEAGEGIGAVQVVFDGAPGRFTTTSLSAGGFQIVLPAGTYAVTASGGGLQHAISLPSITVGTTNIWANLIYDPAAIPPDAMEPNNTTASANELAARDQTLSGLSIHPGDVDYFKVTPNGTGPATFELRFTQANGDLDLRLLSATGSIIASAVTVSSPESVTANLERGVSYFVQVFSSTNATNGMYSLQVRLPQPAPPQAVPDRGMTAQGASELRLGLLDNDTDPDGPKAALMPTLQTLGIGSFTINSARSLSYTPPLGYGGIDRATYSITDDQGLASGNATIEVFVLNFAAASPWRNARKPLDVNDDGVMSPLDALLVINEIVARGSRVLPTLLATSTAIYGFVDTSGSNTLEPRDALLVINELNRIRRGNGEGESTYHTDLALQQLTAEDFLEQRKKRR